MPRDVTIPQDLYQRVSERAESSEFSSVDAYVEFVLKEVVAEHPELDGDEPSTDDEQAKERLRKLGYID